VDVENGPARRIGHLLEALVPSYGRRCRAPECREGTTITKHFFAATFKKRQIFWSKYNLGLLIFNRSTKQGWFRYHFTIFTMDKFAHRDDTTETGDSAPSDLNIPVFDRQKLPVKLEAFKK
jgi:hypothetical protein